MQEIKKLRKALGLSQPELAELLETSTGVLAMAEIGKRSLNQNASDNFTSLQIAVEKANSEFDTEQALLKGRDATEILNKLIRSNSRLLTTYLDRQEKQLVLIKQKELLVAIGEQQQTAAILPEGSEALDFYNILKRKAQQQLIELNKEYIKLKLKIYGLQNEIELANVLKSN